MDLTAIKYNPLPGRTYSLFGDHNTTKNYYDFISSKIDALLQINDDPLKVLDILQESSKRSFFLRSLPFKKRKNYFDDDFFNDFEDYLTDVNSFLKSLSPFTAPSSTTRTTENQYKLYMMEAELTNRINLQKFKNSNFKLALLPHCLRDFRDQCKAREGEIDSECTHCTKDCFINHSSGILKKFEINPYIWTSRNLTSLLKPLIIKYKKIGVLGIACIPELVMGMRRCAKYGIPAIGVPLSANRCIRWMGNYYENSVDVHQLEMLLS